MRKQRNVPHGLHAGGLEHTRPETVAPFGQHAAHT